jgi:hypothetical protein
MFTRHKHDHDTSTHDRHGDHRDAVDRDRDGRADHAVDTRGATASGSVAHDRFGGMNWGADFFGWLVAVAATLLLSGIISGIVAAVGQEVDIAGALQREAGTAGIVAAVVLVVVSAIGYYAGGYVAGRMSRFDGARQGLGVWLIGLLVMILAGVAGALFGREANVLDRISLPRLPLTGEEMGIGALVTLGVLLLVTLLAAMAGGKVGHHYHDKVDDSTRMT